MIEQCTSTLDMRPIADVDLRCVRAAGHDGLHNAKMPGESNVVRRWIVGITPGAKP